MKLGLFIFAAALAGCETKPQPCVDAVSAAQKANAEATKAQADQGTAVQNRLLMIQMEIVKRCSDKGGYPVLIPGGNVDCKIPSK